ncbi:MAG: biotin/lipoyl-binding protein [Planktomarina sp.]|uniref:acetyl/propionyl/methylcrotonyl-CoA carboxylase subunit alpha n=1 Tax=Planktomarina sp. TaxID=2024851 RepID=UPI0032606965|nr:biotin/lipoyl-binding protein [Planktomarina sp.]
MIEKLLIANRGEIACRIARSAREMGIATLAIASEADEEALHVQSCDEVVYLGGHSPAESYLRRDAIIDAARARGADAVHPGYGFLSEDPDFAQAVQEAGLIWVGPPASAIRAMGLKDAAKALMQKAGVPIVPGYHGEGQSLQVLQQAAAEIGYPILIKAVAGGGGKGMRRVDRPEDFAAHLASAQSEAQGAFGNARVLIEKFIANPRHIEIQVFGDGQKALHLYERDCSLQRRHQKVIEEAPAPHMPNAVRDAMGRAAVRAAEAIGYASAGTVEFIVDGSAPLQEDSFYFMEMNTRLQVEHPVTEEILGIDLVAWQLEVAAGGLLPLKQEQVQAQGHSIEARLYAEDSAQGFLPSIGQLHHLTFGPGLRVETGVAQGGQVTPYYDPMIAKLIATGPDRASALRRLLRGLGLTQIAGLKTNRDFLIALLQHEDFVAGTFDTGLIARDMEALTRASEPAPEDWARAALCAMGLLDTGRDRPGDAGFTLFTPLRQSLTLRHQDQLQTVQASLRPGGQAVVDVAGEILAWGARDMGQRPAVLAAGKVYLFDGQTLVFDVMDPLKRIASVQSDGAITAPMPGLVKQVFVRAGQEVAAGDPIVVLEAMKMQHTLCADFAGRVENLTARQDQQVDAGVVLAVIEAAPEEA